MAMSISSTETSAPTELPHAYRTAPIKSYCGLCGEVAVVRCLCCGRPHCALHAPGAKERCIDCERGYRRTANRVKLGCTLTALAIGAAIVLASTWVHVPWAIGTAVGIAFVGGWFLTAASLGVARGRFLANNSGDLPLLEDADLTIAPAGPEDRMARCQTRGWRHRGRGEMPQVPVYQRTYGVG